MPDSSLFTVFPVLHTERLTLRQMNVHDAADLYGFYSDKQLTKYLDWFGPASVEQSIELIHSWNAQFEDRRLFPWGITLAENNRLIGTIMYMPLRGTFETRPLFPVTVGFELSRTYWNRGIMSEALSAVISFGKKQLDAHRIQAEVVPENTVSLKLLEKFGFRQEGLFRQYLLHEATKMFLDVIMLSLINNV